MRKSLKCILTIVLVVIIAAACVLTYYTVTEYNPTAITELDIKGAGNAKLSGGQTINVLSWNIGYGALGAEADFFMDGGSHVRTADKETSQRYLNSMKAIIEEKNADVTMLQEVDVNSHRSYYIDQSELLAGDSSAFAYNYVCNFVPFPMPPIGKVNAGIMTSSSFTIDTAERISLPCPFSWPVRTANLKRCLLASYIPVENSDKQLVIVNLHLEAYDSGDGKIAQTKMLVDFMESEYQKGNYVIVGGDFNQQFPGATQKYNINHPELWAPGTLDVSMLEDGWELAYDLNFPSCRLLNQPYNPEDTANTEYYVIDGFILSPNIKLNMVETIDAGFVSSDHNPVYLTVTLEK